MTPELRALRGKAATLSFDVLSAAAAMGAAALTGFLLEEMDVPAQPMLFAGALMAAGFALAAAFAFVFLRIHHQVWRHMGWADAVRVAQAAGLTWLFFLPAVLLLDRFVVLPRTAVLIVIPVWLALLFGGRMLALTRSTEAPLRLFQPTDPDAPLVLLVGRIEDVSRVLRDRNRARSIRALGILTLDAPEIGRAVQGVALIGGLDALGDAIDLMSARYQTVPSVALVGSGHDPAIGRRVLAIAAQKGARLVALSSREAGGAAVRKLRPADLLGRPERSLDPAPVAAMIAGRRVLVTGAGGSIGAALVKACAAYGPASLTLLDQGEFNLYAIDLALGEAFPALPRRAVIGDVRDPARLSPLMAELRPEIVLHAAALKHVPLMEGNASEAVLTNALGAETVARLACEAGAKHFVLISSDKAVSPSNTMGATKRLAELRLTAVAAQCPDMAVAMVRFGNVLGSSGSVMPRFEAQIAAGGPVTVIHPDATRYFMTIEEAAKLVLQAAAQARAGGEASLFMLDMGEPVRVLELAETMIRLSGYEPYRDIEITFTGPRAGDRLHEALVTSGEASQPTGVDGLNRVLGAAPAKPEDAAGYAALLAAARRHDEAGVRECLAALVPGYSASATHAD